MRIDLFASSATNEISDPGSKANSTSAASESALQDPEDRTTLVSGSDSISSLTALAMQSGPARADKVQALQQAVSNGQYQSSPAKIADAMVSGN